MAESDWGLAVRVDGARAYVLAHGGARERARLGAILEGAPAEPSVVRELEGLQNQDGGFPTGEAAGKPSSVAATCRLLALMRELTPLGGSPMASRALAFLRRLQRRNGSWAGANREEAAHMTALAAHTLLTMDPAHLDPVVRAERWLRLHVGRNEPAHTFETLALAFAVWYRIPGPTSVEVARASGLLAGLDLGPAEQAGWLSAALEAGMGGPMFPAVLTALRNLAASQGEDGAWPAGGGSAVESTLDALRVFRGFGLA